MNEGDMDSTKKRRLLEALLVRPTIRQAAEDAGVSLATAFRWRRQPKFRSRLDELRRASFEQGLCNLQSLGTEAVETLRRNLSCGKPSVEVAAAAKIVDIGLKFSELADITRRLDELEEARKQSDWPEA